ncbi:MAG TPA: carboxypeptidase regulatory-like domain-containing protein [Actinocatenispora sp.]
MTKTTRGWWAPAIGAGLILGVLVAGAGLAVTGHIDHDKYGWRWPAAIGAAALLAAILLVLAAVLRERAHRRVRRPADAATGSPVPGFATPAADTPADAQAAEQPVRLAERFADAAASGRFAEPARAGRSEDDAGGRLADDAPIEQPVPAYAGTAPTRPGVPATQPALAGGGRTLRARVAAGDDRSRTADLPEWAGPTWGGEVRPNGRRRPPEPEPAGVPVRGYVRDAGNKVVAEAAVTLIDLSGRQTGRCVTGVDGWYQVPAPTSGTYTLIVRARGHQPSASVVAVGAGPVELPITLTGTAVLTGTVRLAGGTETVPGATVSLVDSGGEVLAAGTADDTGGYRFTELLAGGYTVVAHAPGYRPAAVPVLVPETGTLGLDVGLVGGASVLGVARADRDRRPLPDTLVTLYDARGEAAGQIATDDDGRYHFDDVAAGEYTLVASGFPAVSAEVRLTAGEHREYDVTLSHHSA